jgi:hypothetical protein
MYNWWPITFLVEVLTLIQQTVYQLCTVIGVFLLLFYEHVCFLYRRTGVRTIFSLPVISFHLNSVQLLPCFFDNTYCMWAFTIKGIFICFRNIHIYLRIPARLSCFSIFATTIFGSEAKFSCRFLIFLLGQQFFFFQQAVYSCSLNYRTVKHEKEWLYGVRIRIQVFLQRKKWFMLLWGGGVWSEWEV